MTAKARNEDEALRDYQEVVEKLDAKLEEYGWGPYMSEPATKLDKPITPEALSEIKKLHNEEKEKFDIWMEFMDKL